MTISNFERLSGDTVLRDMSLIWWVGTTYKYDIHLKRIFFFFLNDK